MLAKADFSKKFTQQLQLKFNAKTALSGIAAYFGDLGDGGRTDIYMTTSNRILFRASIRDTLSLVLRTPGATPEAER